MFAGTRRFIHLPPGWTCDHTRWEWRVLEIDPSEHTTKIGLYVWTRHDSSGEERWREVLDGAPGYSEGQAIGYVPGTIGHVVKVEARP